MNEFNELYMNFKSKAQQHQLSYFADCNQLGAAKAGRAQDHWLNHEAAAIGKNFYDGYNVFKAAKDSRGNKQDTPEWFYDTLRSQHIPFNFFIPFNTEKELGVAAFNDLFKTSIKEIKEIRIEYPPKYQNPLGDKTSFDAFVSYIAEDGKKGLLGIEVKYTEGGYSPTDREKGELENKESAYFKATEKSKLYIDNIVERLKENNYRQIWRNHILAFSFARTKGYKYYKSVTVYHEGNNHFKEAFKEYDAFLTDKGKETIQAVTYAEFVDVLNKHVTIDEQRRWVEYLKARYNVSIENSKNDGE